VCHDFLYQVFTYNPTLILWFLKSQRGTQCMLAPPLSFDDVTPRLDHGPISKPHHDFVYRELSMWFTSILPRSELPKPQIWWSRSSLDLMDQIILRSLPTTEMLIFWSSKSTTGSPLDMMATIKSRTPISWVCRTLTYDFLSCELPIKPYLRFSSLLGSMTMIKLWSLESWVLTNLSLNSLSH